MADTLPGATNCPSGTFVTVLMNYLDTLHNIFPIKFAGITLLNFGGLEDYDDAGDSVICTCLMPPPIFFRIGFPLHLWEPADVIETVQQPWCSPSLGINLGLGFNKFAIGGQDGVGGKRDATSQAHLISYPIWWLIGLFEDIICFQASTGFDYLYVTELDPLWQNDLWASILGPEAALFANPIAQMACPIDCAAATIGFPIDYLFWCQGCWNGTYPLGQTGTSVDYLQTNAGLAARFIYKMHRELVMWITSGPMMLQGYCQPFPFPIEKKTQYNLLPIYPFRNENRMPIGRTSLLWSPGKDNPFQSNYVWAIYRARDCCAF
jgi:conjugal transfer pilus assembly protein TraU